MYYTDNPDKDFDRWDREQQEKLDRYPKCHACGEPITDATCLWWNRHKYHVDCKYGWADDAYREFLEAT